MKKLIAFLLVLALAVSMTACGTDPDPAASTGSETQAKQESTPAPTGKPAPETAPPESTAPPKSVYSVGDTARDGDVKIVYTACGEYVSDNDFLQPDEGQKYIFFRFSFENGGDSDFLASSFDFSCFADGYAAESFFGGKEDLSATISSGRSASGSVYFTVPVDASVIEVEYDPNIFLENDTIKFLYEGNKDSGYVSEIGGSSSDSLYQVGDTVESDKLNITYLACREFTSDNMFLQPDEGNKLISCEFEFENVGDSEELISSFSFDCYADGAACEQSFQGEQLDATITPGRKTKGEVIFEVPADASVIEVEYLSNIWTSDRVVFNAMP